MKTTTIRIDKSTYNLLKEIAQNTHKSMNDLIVEMTNEYQKRNFWEKVNDSYIKLKNNNKSWNEELEERKVWDTTLNCINN